VVDTPTAIKRSFQGELLEARASNLWTARKILGGHPLVLQCLAMGDRLMITVANADAATAPLTAALEGAGLSGVAMAPAAANLEDLFVQIVRRQEG